MTEIDVLAPERRGQTGYKVDVTRGERVGRVSSKWFSRPADERLLSLSELFFSVNGLAERSRTRTVESAAVRVEASRTDAERLALVLPGSDAPVAPTHRSFGQLASLVGAPAAYQTDINTTDGMVMVGMTTTRLGLRGAINTDNGLPD